MRPGQPVRARQELIAQWAQTAVAVPLDYASSGRSVAWAALAGSRRFECLRHYPAKDVVDRVNGTRFYYHAHGEQRWSEPEHGHFHLFADRAAADGFMHLAALSLDAQGRPLRWFATNGWVTGERWRPAPEVVPELGHFEVHAAGRMAPVARWLTAMAGLFGDQIAQLLYERDARLTQLANGRPLSEVWQDRAHDVLASCPANLPDQLARLGLV